MALAKGFVFKGDAMVKNARAGLENLAAGTCGTEGGERAVVEL